MMVSYLILGGSLDSDSKKKNCEKKHVAGFQGCLDCVMFLVP